MSCLHYCCYCCCYCCDQCCPHRKRKPEKPVKFPQIEYMSPDVVHQSVSARHQEEKLSIEREYIFAQPAAEVPYRPMSSLAPITTVTEQPRRQARSFTPSYSPSSSPVHFRHQSTPEPSDTTSETGTISSLQAPSDSHPTLQFSLYYDIQRRVLAVHVQQAYNLPVVVKGNSTFACSPFVWLSLLPHKEEVYESKMIPKNVNPEFDQMFDFHGMLPENIRKQTLVLKVFHRRSSKHSLLGMISLPLEDVDLYGVSVKMSLDERMERYSSGSRGNVLVSITHRPDTSSLQGMILRAKDLQKVDTSGTASPYVRVYQLYNGKRVHKWKTNAKRNTLTPIFNEPFRFDITSMDLHSISIELLLMDHNRFAGDECMGIIRIGESAPEETGRSHWSEMLRTPGKAISRWHTVWPITHVYDGGSDRESILTTSTTN